MSWEVFACLYRRCAELTAHRYPSWVRRLVTAINRNAALRNRIDPIFLSLKNAQERRGSHAYDQDMKTS